MAERVPEVGTSAVGSFGVSGEEKEGTAREAGPWSYYPASTGDGRTQTLDLANFSVVRNGLTLAASRCPPLDRGQSVRCMLRGASGVHFLFYFWRTQGEQRTWWWCRVADLLNLISRRWSRKLTEAGAAGLHVRAELGGGGGGRPTWRRSSRVMPMPCSSELGGGESGSQEGRKIARGLVDEPTWRTKRIGADVERVALHGAAG